MAGYSYVGQVSDPAAQKALRAAFDQITSLSRQLAELQAEVLSNRSAIDAGGQRIVNVGNPRESQDAVPVSYLKAYVSGQLEGFKGKQGVSGTIDTTATQVVTVKNGIITEIA